MLVFIIVAIGIAILAIVSFIVTYYKYQVRNYHFNFFLNRLKQKKSFEGKEEKI